MNGILRAMVALAAFGAVVAGPSGYHETQKVTIPGPTGWDYVTVDSVGRRVYISHATQVEVLDADTLKAVEASRGPPAFTESPSPRKSARASSPREKRTPW